MRKPTLDFGTDMPLRIDLLVGLRFASRITFMDSMMPKSRLMAQNDFVLQRSTTEAPRACE